MRQRWQIEAAKALKIHGRRLRNGLSIALADHWSRIVVCENSKSMKAADLAASGAILVSITRRIPDSPAGAACSRQFSNQMLEIGRQFAVNRDTLSRVRMDKLKIRGMKRHASN